MYKNYETAEQKPRLSLNKAEAKFFDKLRLCFASLSINLISFRAIYSARLAFCWRLKSNVICELDRRLLVEKKTVFTAGSKIDTLKSAVIYLTVSPLPTASFCMNKRLSFIIWFVLFQSSTIYTVWGFSNKKFSIYRRRHIDDFILINSTFSGSSSFLSVRNDVIR